MKHSRACGNCNDDSIDLDWVAIDGDGLECLQKMIVLRHDLKVVINTANSEFKQGFRYWCADRFVIKSSDLSALKTTVKELLDEPVCTAPPLAKAKQHGNNSLFRPPG
jgi:hypothetical protein